MNPPIEPPEPILVAHLFPGLLEQLLALLRQLEDADWRQPTACGSWSVHDVALHLLGVEIGNLSARRDDHTSGAFIDDWDALVEFINRWNQEWVWVARRISPPLLIDLLELTGGQMSTCFQSLDPYAIGGPVSWAGPEPAPVWLDVAREYSERWHHQQHIRDAVSRPGLKEPRYLAPVLAAVRPGPPAGLPHDRCPTRDQRDAHRHGRSGRAMVGPAGAGPVDALPGRAPATGRRDGHRAGPGLAPLYPRAEPGTGARPRHPGRG